MDKLTPEALQQLQTARINHMIQVAARVKDPHDPEVQKYLQEVAETPLEEIWRRGKNSS